MKLYKKNTLPKNFWHDPILFCATGFGSGASPIAPGTFGTIIGVMIYLLISQLNVVPYFLVTLLLLVIGIPICAQACKRLNTHDHPGIVWDEIVGFLITMFFSPVNWLTICLGFLLFRLFDIWKPWPIKVCDQKVPGGLGVMLDDVLAGVYSLCALQIILYFFCLGFTCLCMKIPLLNH